MKIISNSILVFILLLISHSQTNGQKNVNSNLSYVNDSLYFNFESYTSAKLSENWATALTGKGDMSIWEIVSSKNNNVLEQVSNEKYDYRFNIIVNKSINCKNVDIQLKLRGVNGTLDQGGGAVWRYQDANNYYVARANPLENNYRLYKVENGNRVMLKTSHINMKSNKWYKLKIVMKDNTIKCFFNEKLKMQVEDNTFKQKGSIGLWTKSDAVTYFDNVKIKCLQ